MIFTAEIMFITVSVVVVLGGLVYMLHNPRKRDTAESDESKGGAPDI